MDWISVVEAAYALEGDVESWGMRILEALAPLWPAASILAGCIFRRVGDEVEIERILAGSAAAEPVIRGILGAAGARLPASLVFGGGAEFASLCQQVPDRADDVEKTFRSLSRDRFADGCGGIAHSGDGRAIALGAALRERGQADPVTCARWQRVASHLGAGLRLVSALRAEPPEAVLDPDGRVRHAEAPALAATAREQLRAAVRKVDSARTRASRSNADAALASWQGLVAGRWSLVDHFESDGRRFVVARRNDPAVPDPRGLSRSEAQIAQLLALGHSQKQIAYTLGMSPSSVSRRIQSGARKLRVRSRAELAAVFASVARGVAVSRLRLAGDELHVQASTARSMDALDDLSPAERAVAGLASLGSSDAEIARQRGASARTVENQLQSAYRKLGVHSRTELAARVSA